MEVVRPRYLPDPALSRAEMEELQRDLASEAVFADDLSFDPAAIAFDGPLALDADQRTLGGDGPIVAGVDQAFTDDRAVSAVVAIQNGEIVERATGSAPLDVPYIPGLLSFREGGAIVDALEALSTTPDALLVDGSGRIHFREAGLATHVGVLFDVPSVGVAKNLLCGTPRESLDDPLPEGTRVAIEADEGVSAPAGTVIGYAVQSRQYPNPETRHVNPLYVSPGHRASAETATDIVERCCAGYKLPEPTRAADAAAGDLTAAETRGN